MSNLSNYLRKIAKFIAAEEKPYRKFKLLPNKLRVYFKTTEQGEKNLADKATPSTEKANFEWVEYVLFFDAEYFDEKEKQINLKHFKYIAPLNPDGSILHGQQGVIDVAGESDKFYITWEEAERNLGKVINKLFPAWLHGYYINLRTVSPNLINSQLRLDDEKLFQAAGKDNVYPYATFKTKYKEGEAYKAVKGA